MRGIFSLFAAFLIISALIFLSLRSNALALYSAALKYRSVMDAHYLRRDLEYSLLKAFEYSHGENPEEWMRIWFHEWERVGAEFEEENVCVSVIREGNIAHVKTTCPISGRIRGLYFFIPKGYGVSVWTGGH